MSSIESIGKTTEEAIHLGLLQLGVEQEDVTIEVVEEASHGFLGIGGKPARVRLTLIKAADEEPAQEEKSVEEVLLLML